MKSTTARGNRTRKSGLTAAAPTNGKGKGKQELKLSWDEDIDDGYSSEDGRENSDDQSDSDDVHETADQKRIRLAKAYLQGIDDKEESDEDESKDDDEENEYHRMSVTERLRVDRLSAQGKMMRSFSKSLGQLEPESVSMNQYGGHKESVTSVSLSSDTSFVISGSKDNSVIRWDSETGAKTSIHPRWTKVSGVEHSRNAEILATAISTDMKYCVTGGRDKLIRIFDLRSNVEIKAFEGHRDAVTSLAFRHGSYSLYSSSLDRCVKHWDLQEMGYLETLFGHQEGVFSVDCWRKDRPVSSSGDRTIRSWNVSNDTHLVFRGHHSGIDNVQILTDDMMVSGGPDGSIRLWKETQKKSIAVVSDAHGHDASSTTARWIYSLCAVKMSDLVLSGSNDGYLRFWSTNNNNGKYSFSNPFSFPIDGFINSISVCNQVVAVGTGREPKFGRWACEKGNKNKLVILRVPIIDEGAEVDG